jgi:peptidoglycan/xylan/chitin deacetylase (PgdA/CDA1 family)
MRTLIACALLVLALGVAVFARRAHRPAPPLPPAAATAALEGAAAHPERATQAEPIIAALRAELDVHRRLILLFADEAHLKGAAREAALAQGHALHHQDRDLVHALNLALVNLAGQTPGPRDPLIAQVLDWMERDPEIMELDRLAFRDPLRVLESALAPDHSAEGAALTTRIRADLAEVDRVEHWVDAEYRQVFGGPGSPAKGGQRLRWDAYVKALQALIPMPVPPPAAPAAKVEPGREINGRELPEKVLVLSFDDGPHRVYTGEIKAILQQGHAPAVFFEVGRNLGSVAADGTVKLGPLAPLTEDLVRSGYVIGNHSFSHAQLSKETGPSLDLEIREPDLLLRAIPGAHSNLFRFPYGARTAIQLQALQTYHLRSVLWNIDSLDWADPVPSSVADRVLRTVAEEKRGIILFHDIHDRAGKVLPALLERLRGEGYRFAGLDGNGEVVLP